MPVRTIDVRERVMARNDELATRVRATLRQAGVVALNLVSSPGSGKTTLLERTLETLGDELDLAVVTGDVQTQNDADRLARHTDRLVQAVVTGGACHLDALQVLTALGALDLERTRLLFIENVGNLVCPASWDLGEEAKVVVFSVTEGEDKPLKYPKMFREARYAVLNKMDLLPHLSVRSHPGGRERAGGQSRAPLLLHLGHDRRRHGLVVRVPPGAGSRVRAGLSARRVHVTGVVQGVGFRPFVHRLALRHGLAGWVRNESGEVHIEVEGSERELTAFLRALRREAPPLARVEQVESVPAVPRAPRASASAAVALDPVGASRSRPTRVSAPPARPSCSTLPTAGTGYPFITCTDCGPRFTVIEALPYDRERTSMRAFRQCDECLREYGDPADRRYHSETNCCSACGPRVWYEPAGSTDRVDGEAGLEQAAALLRAGGILALRGLGGFHLAADAIDDVAVGRLRAAEAPGSEAPRGDGSYPRRGGDGGRRRAGRGAPAGIGRAADRSAFASG